MSKLAATEYDPLFLHARREMGISFLAWLMFFGWVIGYSAWRAYGPIEEGAPLETVLGMPAWVFWGIAVPWVAANLFIFWFAFGCMADDPLTVVESELADRPDAAQTGDSEVSHG